jgi:hypothetical protein
MQTATSSTLFPTLGPWYHRQVLRFAALCRPLRHLYRAVTLRRLMVFVLVLGGLLGWYVRSVRIQQAAVAAIEKTGGSVFYDVQNRNEGPVHYRPFGLKWLFEPSDLAPKWLVDRIGLDYVGTVVSARLGPWGDDATMHFVSQLDRLEDLGLIGSQVTDAGLVQVKGLQLLRGLQLSQTQVSDIGLAYLKGMKELRLLGLWKTQVTDDGVLELQYALPQLQVIRDEDLDFSAAIPRAMADVNFARTQPIRVACQLMGHRAWSAAQRGERAEVIASAEAVCKLDANDKISLLRLASACASCLRSLDLVGSRDLTVKQKQAIEEQLARHGIAALRRAFDLGLRKPPESPQYSFWPLDRYPGFKELEKASSPHHARQRDLIP